MRLQRKYRPRASSLLFVGVTAFLGIGAIQADPNLMPLIFGVAIAGLVSSGLVGGMMLMGLRPRRLPLGSAQVGTVFRVRYELESRARFLPSFALGISETPSPKRRPGWEEYFSREGGAGRAFVAQVGPRESVRAVGRFEPVKRGACAFCGVEVTSGFPFGLFHKVVASRQGARVLIRPRVRALRPGAVPRLLSRLGHEAQTSRKRRTGEEFFSLREYVEGDSPRFIAWRTSARLDTLVIREHAERTWHRVRALLLVSPEAASEDVERAIELYASLSSALVRTEVSLSMRVPQASASFDGARPASIGALLDALALLDHTSPVPEAFESTREALVLVRTDEVSGLPTAPAGCIVFTSRDLDRLAKSVGGEA